MNPTKTCRWVLASGQYCNKPVRWYTVLDDDKNKKREYKAFCNEHEKVAKQDQDE